MASYYSILSIIIRPEIQEKISVGLLFFDGNNVIFNYSDNKLNVSKELLSDNSFKILKDVIKAIKANFEDTYSLYSVKKGLKIFSNSNFDNVFTSEYFEYLSRYSNNLIGFSAPKPINLEPSFENYNKLFFKYIDINPHDKFIHNRIKPVELIKTQHKEISNYYNIGNEVNHNYIPGLITPVKVDFSGQNGVDVYAQALDMEQPYNHISYHINAFIQLKAAYEESKRPIKDFVIANEPPKHLKKQHDIWVQLRSSGKFTYIDITESQKIIDYAVEHNVKPLLANYIGFE